MTRDTAEIQCALREYRLRKGWSQEELARMINVRRQAVYDMESGKYLPNTAIALRLARLFGCAVENLFRDRSEEASVAVRVQGGQPQAGERLALGRVRGNLAAFPLDLARPLSFTLEEADGVLDRQGTARPLVSPEELDRSLIILGCNPALDLLSGAIRRHLPQGRARCFFSSSRDALNGLADGMAHVAATHFSGPGDAAQSGGQVEDANVQAARLAISSLPCRILAFSRNEEGLMTAAGNPQGIHSVADLARPGLRFVNREPGAALRKLLDTQLAEIGMEPLLVPGYENEVRSHSEGACLVACGAADAALGLGIVARAFGLNFVPLAETRCDLVLPLDLESHPAVSALLDMLQSSRLHSEIAALPGYDASCTGREIARIGMV
ncbi:helix-turn-helix domain-containing protein [Desulfovibrio sp. OttesenSCG-928-F20]|nr:helix-turn-helix domain-containing protein [Desulfovibrio sp. OttesenSCG-928-F20]